MNIKKKIYLLDIICFIALVFISFNINMYSKYIIFINMFLSVSIIVSTILVLGLYFYDNKNQDTIKYILNAGFISLTSFIVLNQLYINDNILKYLPFLNKISFINIIMIVFIIIVLCIVFYFVYLSVANKSKPTVLQQSFTDNNSQVNQNIDNQFKQLNKSQNSPFSIINYMIIIFLCVVLLIIFFIIAYQFGLISEELGYITLFLDFIFFGVLTIVTIATIIISISLIIKFMKYFYESMIIFNYLQKENKEEKDLNRVFSLFLSFILLIILYTSRIRNISVNFLNSVFDNQDIALLLLIPFTIVLFFVCSNVILKILSDNSIEKISIYAEKILKDIFIIVNSTITELLQIAKAVPNMLEIFLYEEDENKKIK